MRVLVIGGSNTDGRLMEDPSASWTDTLRRKLEAQDGVPVEMVSRRYYVHTKDWREYLEGILGGGQNDVIILGINGVSWTFRTVPIRVRKLFGRRAGEWVERRQQKMDRAAKGNGGMNVVARTVHWSVRHLIPPATVMGRAEAERRYLEILDRLAREEASHVIVMNKSYQYGALLKAWPEVNREIDGFNAVVGARAKAKHLVWFERHGILDEVGVEAAFAGSDGIHPREVAHQALAEAMFALLRPDAGEPAEASPTKALAGR